MKTQVRKIGNSLGIILPKEIIDQLKLKQGDELELQNEAQKIILSALDKDFVEWSEAYSKLNENYKDVLAALAK